MVPNGIANSIGAGHGQEIAFVFANVDGVGYAVDPFEGKPASFKKLAVLIATAWAGFVDVLDPNVSGM